jgi:hypothetical protein
LPGRSTATVPFEIVSAPSATLKLTCSKRAR